MMRSVWIACLAALLAWLCAPPAGAQDGAQDGTTRRLEAHVTMVSGASVYLDLGNDAGLEPGDRGRALPVGAAPVELIVRSVSRQSARCEFAVGASTPIEIGALVELTLPSSRSTAGADSPDHPPWAQPLAGWKDDMPLLAPAQSLTPAERERKFIGRWYTSLDATFDHAGDAQTYTLARTGLDLEVDNAFGRGDNVRFDAEVYRRANEDSNSTDAIETRMRLDRLSWSSGSSRDARDRLEVGRFLHSQLPQLGLLDGVEWVRRTASGDHFGASLGLQPEWTAEMSSGDDIASSLFYRHVGGDKGQLSMTGAFQKTWHKGQADRDLALGDLSWRPNERWWLYASAWLDYYGSGDAPKSSGFELTQLQASANYRPDKATGIGLSATQIRWPVLLKNELPPATLDLLADGQVERIGLNGWRDLTQKLRLYARADHWTSNTDSGTGGELRATWRDLFFDSGSISAAVFANDGELTQVSGLRLSAYRTTASGTWTLAWELADFEQATGNGVSNSFAQSVLRGGWDTLIGEAWNLSLSADTRFGDEQDAQSVGFWLQRRF